MGEVWTARVAAGGNLQITDSCVMAKELKARGEAVLVLLHEGNRGEDFSCCHYAYEAEGDPGQAVEKLLVEETYLDYIYRREKGLPVTILETKRCVIRETTVEDVDAFYEIYAEPSVTRYMEALYDDPEEERVYARDYIDKVYAFYDFGIWTVVKKSDGAVIGRAGICYREGFEDPELGFLIGVPWQGRGLATEVCRAVLDYGRSELGFERILAFVQPENSASRRICEKIGMRQGDRVCIKGQDYLVYET